MRPLTLLLCVVCALSFTACHGNTSIKPPPPSLIEGFGVGATEADASKLAWDDALSRAKQLGYERFSVKAVSRVKEYNGHHDDPKGHQVFVQIEVYPHVTPLYPPLRDAPSPKKPLGPGGS